MYGKDAIFLLPLLMLPGCATDEQARQPADEQESVWKIVPMAGQAGFVFASAGLSVLSGRAAAGSGPGPKQRRDIEASAKAGQVLPAPSGTSEIGDGDSHGAQVMSPEPGGDSMLPPAQDRPRRLVFSFPWAGARLGAGDRALVAATARTLSGSERIVIAGYTDDTVGPQRTVSNHSLALARAETVRDAFVAGGFPSARIAVRADARCCYIASNDTEEGRRSNRRVEVLIEPEYPSKELENDG